MASENEPACRVSVVIACRDVERYLDAAIGSARAQSLTDLEILVIDDRSTDSSRARAEAHAAVDPRVIVLDGPRRGPAAARNVALRQAKGAWLAILDGDDLMHPRRLETLLADAEAGGFDMIADNLMVFHDQPEAGKPGLLLTSSIWQGRGTIDLAAYLTFNRLLSAEPPLGYLKPIIRRELLARANIYYDESLRIAEDCDLASRLLAAGARYGYVPYPWYFYRRRDDSVSYRIMPSDIAAMIAAAGRFEATLQLSAATEMAASALRRRSLEHAVHFAAARGQLKEWRWGRAFFTLLTHPRSNVLVAKACYATLKRRARERLGRMRQSVGPPRRTRALILWAGEDSIAHDVARSLNSQSIVPTIVGIGKSGVGSKLSVTVDLLVRIASQGPFDCIYYDDAALLDLVPYALSPEAKLTICAPDMASATVFDRLEPVRR